MKNSTYALTPGPAVLFGSGSSVLLPEKLQSHKRILLVAGNHFIKTGQYAQIRESLKEFTLAEISGIRAEVPLEDVDRVVQAARESRAGAIVAIGGGSVIDCAKAAAALTELPGSCADYFYGKKSIPGKGLFFAALPTTAGTGAEITNNAVLLDPETKVKKSLRHPSMVADLALVDGDLTLSCPPELTANSGLDAFVQAFESVTSPKAGDYTKALSFTALRKIASNLEKAYLNGNDLSARSEMAEGSMLAGMAFSQTGLGAIHGLAHPIGSLKHVPHGKACATLIPAVVEWNKPCCEDLYARIAQECSFGNTADDFLAGCLTLCEKLGVRSNFSEYGLAEEDFDFIVQNCRSASMQLNPRPMSDEDVRTLLGKLI
ncbi:MAG: iron-containing alcohol dehydrogenase [Lentisphaeria bacterium]|nr:iron-containing alcohol dehydrogenase [Lentisphaeria bacterium]